MEKDIDRILKEIFLKRLGIDFEINLELQEENFFGQTINIPPRELILILYDIEKKLEIHIRDDLLILGKFDSYKGVKQCLISSI